MDSDAGSQASVQDDGEDDGEDAGDGPDAKAALDEVARRITALYTDIQLAYDSSPDGFASRLRAHILGAMSLPASRQWLGHWFAARNNGSAKAVLESLKPSATFVQRAAECIEHYGRNGWDADICASDKSIQAQQPQTSGLDGPVRDMVSAVNFVDPTEEPTTVQRVDWKRSLVPAWMVALTEEAWVMHAWATNVELQMQAVWRGAEPDAGASDMSMFFYRAHFVSTQSILDGSTIQRLDGSRYHSTEPRPLVVWVAVNLWYVVCRVCKMGCACTSVHGACYHWVRHVSSCNAGEICETVSLDKPIEE
jgi:hypothetical protein